MLNYDTPRQCLNFNWTDFHYISILVLHHVTFKLSVFHLWQTNSVQLSLVGFLAVGWDVGCVFRDMCRRFTELRLEQMQSSLGWIFYLLVFTVYSVDQAVCMPLYRREIECTLCLLLCHWVTMFCVCRSLMLLLTVAVDHLSILTDWCRLELI